jgi:hypothetical protein
MPSASTATERFSPCLRRSTGLGLRVGLQERAGTVAGHEDAEVDQPLDLGLRHAGEVGQLGCRQPIHAAVILEAVQPAREGRHVPAGTWLPAAG